MGQAQERERETHVRLEEESLVREEGVDHVEQGREVGKMNEILGDLGEKEEFSK